jgi:hypothetical protein
VVPHRGAVRAAVLHRGAVRAVVPHREAARAAAVYHREVPLRATVTQSRRM